MVWREDTPITDKGRGCGVLCCVQDSSYWIKNPTACGDWLNTISCGSEWLVVPLVIVCVLQRRVVLTSC